MTDFYTPQSFFNHAALLRQAFAHCAKFLTAASRRSLGRISVPVWLIILSAQLLIIAMVSSYLTIQLIRRRPILQRKISKESPPLILQYYSVLATFSRGYSKLQGRSPTRYSPVRQFNNIPKNTFSLDLHVLGTPPAFILSQDQTLHCIFLFNFLALKLTNLSLINQTKFLTHSSQFQKTILHFRAKPRNLILDFFKNQIKKGKNKKIFPPFLYI